MDEVYEQLAELRALVKQQAIFITDLKNRVSELEAKSQHREDKEGYEEQGTRYAGRHPRTCACNRCLGIGRLG